MEELINAEIQAFKYSYHSLMEVLTRQREYLQKRAEEGTVSEKYLNHMNFFLEKIHMFMDASRDLFNSIATYQELAHENLYDTQSLRLKIKALEEENVKFAMWLTSLGRDPKDVKFIRKSDFQYV